MTTYTVPSQAQIDRAIAEAHRMRAQALRAGVVAALRWIAHPTLRPHHA